MAAVRVDERTHRLIREIAGEDGQSMPEVVARAMEEYRRKRFFDALNADYAAMRADPQAWAEELAEREAWDVTLADGLEED